MLSIPLATLIIMSSSVGLFSDDFYNAETVNWQAQSIGQDLVDLFLVVPALLIFSFFAYQNNSIARILWGGTLLYLIYTFMIFCFAIHFNSLFVIYCSILGLSFYSFSYFIYSQWKIGFTIDSSKTVLIKIIGTYFFVISSLFYFLWCMEIIPAVFKGNIPASLTETGLLTNPVHVIDLSVVLPGIFIAGIFLLKRNTVAMVMAPVILTFFVFMDITIGFLNMIMMQSGIQVNLTVTYIMILLALVSLILLVSYLNIIRKKQVEITDKAAMHLTL